jgi:hypothetical protein
MSEVYVLANCMISIKECWLGPSEERLARFCSEERQEEVCVVWSEMSAGVEFKFIGKKYLFFNQFFSGGHSRVRINYDSAVLSL